MDIAKKRPTNLRIPEDVMALVTKEAERRGMTQTDFITEALREKLHRVNTKQDGGWGTLAGLTDEDRAFVAKLVECLYASDSRGFRRALAANLGWLMETVAK